MVPHASLARCRMRPKPLIVTLGGCVGSLAMQKKQKQKTASVLLDLCALSADSGLTTP